MDYEYEKKSEQHLVRQPGYGAPPPYNSPAASGQCSPSMSSPSGFTSRSQSGFAMPLSSVSIAGKLRKAVVIPATDAALGSPFLRAYAPMLSGFGISREDFLGFVDKLNRVAVASPPLQILGLAGNIVGMVPLHAAQIVGNSVNLVAKVSVGVVSKGATEICLRDANKEFFGPRGLKVQVAKLSAVAAITRMPILTADGEIDKKAPLLKPLDDDFESNGMSAQQRRIYSLADYIEHLEINDLPELGRGSNALSRMHATVSENQRKKGEKKMLKNRTKAHEEWNKDVEKAEKKYEEKLRELEKEESRAQGRSREKKREEDLRKIEHKREKFEQAYEEKLGKAEKERRKDDKEEKGFKKILFLIVTNLDGRVIG